MTHGLRILSAYELITGTKIWVITEADRSSTCERYEGRVKEGGILLSVHCDDSNWTKRAKEILERTGAEDVSSTGEASADFSKTDKPMPRAS